MLATSWKQTSPTVWRFELRKGVQFHDGTPFTADDVVFSLARTQVEGSDMKSYTNDFKEVRKIDSHTVEIETKTPFPILPDVLSLVYIMSKKWCETNQATVPVDRPEGGGEHGIVQGQWHRALPCARAPAQRAHRVHAQRLLLGQDRRQCDRGGVHPHRQRCHPRGGLAARAKWT